MKKALTRNERELYFVDNGIKKTGKALNLWGDCSGIQGNCSGIRGNFDLCDIMYSERETVINISDLIQEGAK